MDFIEVQHGNWSFIFLNYSIFGTIFVFYFLNFNIKFFRTIGKFKLAVLDLSIFSQHTSTLAQLIRNRIR
jgi:hypothetical protein